MSKLEVAEIESKAVYYPYFDYLRIFLASVVVLGHDQVINWPPFSGSLAVDVFFALSGWLIGGILLRLSKSDLPKFYFNRAVRIWIPYFLAVFLAIAASLVEFVFYQISFVYNIFGTSQLACCVNSMPLNGSTNHTSSLAPCSCACVWARGVYGHVCINITGCVNGYSGK